MIITIALSAASFIGIWLGSGLIISSVDKLSSRINVSRFSLSFFVLGILTSIPEISIGINATLLNDPAIFVGNLLGGVIVIFLLIIPIFGIMNNGIKLLHEFNQSQLLQVLVTIAAPMLLMLNSSVNIYEAILLIILYLLLFYRFSIKQSFIENIKSRLATHSNHILKLICYIILGIIVLLLCSNIIVRETLNLAKELKVSEFLLGLLAISIGTNLPELTVALRSVYSNKKDIALGDYLGSASANTLIFGLLVLVNNGIKIEGNFILVFITMILSLLLFYIFIRTKEVLSRVESLILLFMYFIFVILGLSL